MSEMFSALKILMISYLILQGLVCLIPDKRTPLERRLDRLNDNLKNINRW